MCKISVPKEKTQFHNTLLVNDFAALSTVIIVTKGSLWSSRSNPDTLLTVSKEQRGSRLSKSGFGFDTFFNLQSGKKKNQLNAESNPQTRMVKLSYAGVSYLKLGSPREYTPYRDIETNIRNIATREKCRESRPRRPCLRTWYDAFRSNEACLPGE